MLSSFDGDIVYPKNETKEEVFGVATDNSKSKLIPDGQYVFRKKKKSDNRTVTVTARINNGRWTLLKGSVLGIKEDAGVSQRAKQVRAGLFLDSRGKLLEDYELGECSPSFAGVVVMNSSNNGWLDWKDGDGEPVDKYRKNKNDND